MVGIEIRTDYQDILCRQNYSIVSEIGDPIRKSSGKTKAAGVCARCWYWSALLIIALQHVDTCTIVERMNHLKFIDLLRATCCISYY